MRKRLLMIIAGIVLACLPQGLQGQFTKLYTPFPVVVDGDTLDLPFFGGLNNPKPSLQDFDNDSLIDLLLGDPHGKLHFLKNTGTPLTPIWSPVTERLGDVKIYTWHRLVDIDDDGDLDLFCDNNANGVTYYNNQSVGQNFNFVLVSNSFGGITSGINNTPDFADIDNDGDYDFFLGDPGGQLVFYRNTGTPTTPSFTFVTDFYDSILAFPGGSGPGLGKATRPQHGFSAVNFADIDADLDLDLLWGDLFNPNVYLFRNNGNAASSDYAYLTDTYLSNSYSTFGFNHVPVADLDGDGDLDMIMGLANGENLNNLRLLRNIGSASLASFLLEDQNVIDQIDLGRSSFPALADLDGDGDIDLLIGNGDGRLTHYENIGTRANPSFQRVTEFFEGIDVGLSSMPAIVDWDRDGDFDLLIGNENGFIQYWRNDGSSCDFNAVLASNQYAAIKTDQLAVPVPVDLDKDGQTDLVVGEWDFNGFANVLLYENTGTTGNPQLTLVTKFLLKKSARDFTIPHAADWDGDGKTDLLVGGRNAGMTWFRNTAAGGTFPDSLTLIAQPDSFAFADAGARVTLARADIDSDGDQDLFIGEDDGGINFFRRDGGTPYRAGDADGNDLWTISDAVFLITYIFGGGPAPNPMLNGDADCNGIVTISDAVFLITFIFGGGPAPCSTCIGS